MEDVSFLWFDAVLTNEERARRFAQARVRKTGAMCKFWVTSYCRYGDTCKNRHVYDESKMELCEYYQVGACKKSECLFRHSTATPADVSNQVCKWYAQGFCRHGPACKKKHVKLQACAAYMFGFCFNGPDCSLAHPPAPTTLRRTLYAKPSYVLPPPKKSG